MGSSVCAACGARSWLPLPDVGERSVTTSGDVIDEPLGKSQCGACGLGQRTRAEFLAVSDYYKKGYRFYERPGAARFDAERYAVMARWIADAVASRPERVMDVGCGRGWMIEALCSIYPHARFSGIEPSESDSEDARRRGLDVVTGRVASVGPCDGEYDLVYATNVLEHTASPVDFLVGLKRLTARSGEIVITCPDATHPNQELMFSDQNFSLLPAHLRSLAAQAGLEVSRSRAAPGYVGLRDKQLAVLRHANGTSRVRPSVTEAARDRLYTARVEYLHSWEACALMLERETARARRVYNFGASTWSFLLAGYCREYWTSVTACITDGGTGSFLGKPVRDATITLEPGDVVVLGTDPEVQSTLASRFAESAAKLVVWNGIVDR